ncbi:MAG: hypothetical protein ACYC6Y_29120 [Thermoguttaceae bacterium]
MLYETVTDIQAQADVVRRRRFGVIEARDGAFHRILFRPWPTWVSIPEVLLWAPWLRRRRHRDRCLLYFDQPWSQPNYLAVKYLLTTAGTSYASVVAARRAVDEVARIKRSDALVCHVSNRRLSGRIMRRWGWEPLNDSPRCTLFVRRFYGKYPGQELPTDAER